MSHQHLTKRATAAPFPPTEQNEAKISWMGVLPCGLDDIISGSGAPPLSFSAYYLLVVREEAESTETFGIQMRVKSVSVTLLIKAGFSAEVCVLLSVVDVVSWLYSTGCITVIV